jgi:hypothetical protein
MKTSVFRICILAVSVLVAAHVNAPGRDNAISICDLLKDLAEYRNQSVQVRGELRTGRHRNALFGVNCEHSVLTDEHVWLDALWLVAEKRSTKVNEPGVDKKAMKEVYDAIGTARRNGKKGKVLLTFVGRIETRERFFGGRGGNGRWIGNGYGHMNAYPAQLVYRSAKDVEVLE